LAQLGDKKNELKAFLKALLKISFVFCCAFLLPSCGSSPGYSYTVGGVVSSMAGSGLVLQNNAGDDLTITNNGSFSFKTTLADGAAYAVTVKTQPTNPAQICTVSKGSGIINSAPASNVVVSCTMNSTAVTINGSFVYKSNYNSATVSSYKIDASSGALGSNATVTAGANPNIVVVDSTGAFAYVSNVSDGTVSAFNVDPTTGALTAIETAVAAGTYPNPVTVATVNSKQYAYVSNMGSNNVFVYAIETDGSLTYKQTVNTETSPANVVVDSTGKFAYVPNVTSGTISVYTIDQDTGLLTAGSLISTGSYPISMTILTIDSSTQFAYVPNMGSGTISVYSINSSTGALTAVETEAAGTYPMSVTVNWIDSTHAFAYVSCVGSNNIYVYTINQSTGALTPSVITATVTTGTYPNPVTIAMVNSKQYAYVSCKGISSSSYYIYIYSVNSDGSLAAVTQVTTGTDPNPVRVDSTGNFAYVSSAGLGTVYAYKIDQDTGVLTDVSGSPYP